MLDKSVTVLILLLCKCFYFGKEGQTWKASSSGSVAAFGEVSRPCWITTAERQMEVKGHCVCLCPFHAIICLHSEITAAQTGLQLETPDQRLSQSKLTCTDLTSDFLWIFS